MKKIALNIHEELSCDQTIVVETDDEDNLEKVLDEIDNSNSECFDDYLMSLDEYGIKVTEIIRADPIVNGIECDDTHEYNPKGE